ncbi:hypothetical protein N9509_01260 [Amylibacter sp.]|jgi:hypothetical protein|nr:hypothetical protein [Amylibacter sp.]
MVEIVEIQHVGHIELKRRQNLNKLGIEKSSNWHIYPHCQVFVLLCYRFISKFFLGKKWGLLADIRFLKLQICAFLFYKFGYIICSTGAELKALAEKYSQKLFIFSMYSKVVQTGYQLISQHLFASNNAKLTAP